MDLPKSIVKEFAKQAVEKKPTVDKPTQLVGTVQVEDGQTFVYLDGSNGSKTPVSETVAYQSGDRVLVSIQNRKATIIGNYTDPSINQALDNVIIEYALSSSSVSFIAWPGEKGEWNTIAPEKEDGSYMWQRTTKISTNPLVNPEISLTCIQGSDGENGYTPYIGSNGNWWINGVDTGYSAEGDDGHSPYINTTTNTWWEWDADIGGYHDTGIVPQGPGVFKSIVFKRFSSPPSTPTGGSYLSPVPSGWSDGIPSGTEQIWISTRVFTSDGESPQTSEWTTPQMSSDTPDIDFEYSWIVTNPGNPTDNPDNWSNAATENSIWMAVRKKSIGTWSSWEINKIKGEDGEDGKGISSTVVSYAKSDDGNTAPTSGWEDGIPPLTDSEPYLWTKTHIVYTSGSPAYTDIYTVSKKGETGADGYSPTVTTGASSDGSTTVTVTNKDGSSTTELVDGTARKDAADAATSATDYISPQSVSSADDGIKVFPKSEKDNPKNYININSSSTDIYKNGKKIAQYSQGIIINDDDGNKVFSAELMNGKSINEHLSSLIHKEISAGVTTTLSFDLIVAPSGDIEGTIPVSNSFGGLLGTMYVYSFIEAPQELSIPSEYGTGSVLVNSISYTNRTVTVSITNNTNIEIDFGTSAESADHMIWSYYMRDYGVATRCGGFWENDYTKAFAIGVGKDTNNRKNAFAVDWDGNVDVNGNLVVQGDNLVSKIQNMLCVAYPETFTVTNGTFTDGGCDVRLVGNSLYVYLNAIAKSAITAGNISNQTMLTINFTDNRISVLYSVSNSGGTSGPNSQMLFKGISSNGQHTITVTLAAIAQNIAKGGAINAYVSIPCVLNWDAY